VWTEDQIDALTETVVQRLLVEGGSARALAAEFAEHLATETPDLPALAMGLPFSLAASGLEEMLGAGHKACVAALDAWRIAALIGAETLALQIEHARPITVADLHAIWSADDPVFGT